MTLAGRYHAFLSYAHEDKETVEWLHKLLSVFWVPWKGRRRIFFDRESLPADGGLSAKLTNALKDSSFLIVCCSIHSVESRWVNLEVIEFLKTHPAEKVLACLVGPKTAGPFAIPQAVQSLQERLKDDLFKPDLRDDPEKLKGRERKAATREALALLAPLVGLAGKDELLDQRRKNLIVGTVLLFVLASGGTGWKLWDDRPQSQINKILAASPDAVKAISAVMTSSKSASPQADIIAKDPATYRYSVIDEWLRTLVLTGHSKDALEAALTIERTDARLHAVTEIMEQLTEGGAIRHYIDHWGHPSWETVPDKAEGSAKAGAGDEAKLAVAVHAANEITETARKIAGAYSRFQVLLSVVDALGKAGKSSEAKVVAHEALEAGRKIEDADSRTWALAKLIETLPMAGQNEETTQIAAEALEAARNIKDKDSHFKALARLGEALAAACKSSEAVETASKIEDESSRSSALVGIVDGLVKAGRYGDARNAARQIKAAGERTKSLVSIVETLVKAGKSEEAKQVANEALEAFRQVKFGVQGRDTPSAQIIECWLALAELMKRLKWRGGSRMQAIAPARWTGLSKL